MGNIVKDINSKFQNQHIKAFINILYTSNWINNKQNKFFKPFGISPQQYNVLRILRGANQPLMVQTIKERMIVTTPNTTRLLDKLLTKGFVNRVPCPNDRRVIHIEITDEGLSLLDKIAKSEDLDHLNNLTEQEAKQLSDLLDKIR